MNNGAHAPRPRGRPPGSKNKSKKPAANPSKSMLQNAIVPMQPLVFDVAPGSDVIRELHDFANRFNLVITVISVYGTVYNVTICRRSVPPDTSPFLACQGAFELVSLRATFYAPSSALKPPELPISTGFYICLEGPQGQIYGGTIAGKVMAASKVVVIGIAYMNHSHFNLPLTPVRPLAVALPPPPGEEAANSTTSAGSGSVEVGSSTGRYTTETAQEPNSWTHPPF